LNTWKHDYLCTVTGLIQTVYDGPATTEALHDECLCTLD